MRVKTEKNIENEEAGKNAFYIAFFKFNFVIDSFKNLKLHSKNTFFTYT